MVSRNEFAENRSKNSSRIDEIHTKNLSKLDKNSSKTDEILSKNFSKADDISENRIFSTNSDYYTTNQRKSTKDYTSHEEELVEDEEFDDDIRWLDNSIKNLHARFNKT